MLGVLPALGTESGENVGAEGDFPGVFLPSSPRVLGPGTNRSDDTLRPGSVSLNPLNRFGDVYPAGGVLHTACKLERPFPRLPICAGLLLFLRSSLLSLQQCYVQPSQASSTPR